MELTAALFDLCKEVARPIIAIDGRAGAGKTTLAEHLQAALSLRYTTSMIHLDALYNGWENAFDHHLTDSLTKAVNSHKNSADFALPQFDWYKNQFGQELLFPSKELLILEGVGSSQRIIRSSLTTSIWIEIDAAQGLERVLVRDGESISDEMKSWLIQQEKHFLEEGSESAADFALTTS